MGDYTEHLITQAGGNGEDALDLDAIQARADLWRHQLAGMAALTATDGAA